MKCLTDEDFEQEIQSGLTLVDFFTEWCGPCKRLAPILEKVAGEMQDKASIVKVDVEKSPKTATTFGVNAFPTLVLFKDGEEIGRLMGLHPEKTIQEFILNGWFA
jgi:thioredoxin 1